MEVIQRLPCPSAVLGDPCGRLAGMGEPADRKETDGGLGECAR
jgi:hypothetical protein